MYVYICQMYTVFFYVLEIKCFYCCRICLQFTMTPCPEASVVFPTETLISDPVSNTKSRSAVH
jgi:hypothetical protein